MIRATCRVLQALTLTTMLTAPAVALPDMSELQPYQMVRSLQIVQDRIAGGDHASMPMQMKLLELIDMRMRNAAATEFEDPRNIQALMVYAMSGGNPSTVASGLARLKIPEHERKAGAGVLGYLTGDTEQARAALSSIDPADHSNEVAAFLSLIKGSVMSIEKPAEGLVLLDQARLLSPGTLVEEAALRRTVTLAISTGNSRKFLQAAEQYTRRYLRSPYASQFAESFVNGLITLRKGLNLQAAEDAIAWMTDEQAKTIYLRLARRAAIDGDAEFLEFASMRAAAIPETKISDAAARSDLYSSISSVTSATVVDVLSHLEKLPKSGLSEKDRALLDAAKAVANEVVAPVSPTLVSVPAKPNDTAEEPSANSELLNSTRARLEAIDKLLEETEQ